MLSSPAIPCASLTRWNYLETELRNSFGWPTLGCMHQKTVGMFLTVPFLMMGVVESREVLEVVVM